MSIVTGLVIALIVSVVITLAGGILLSLAKVYEILTPISWTTLVLGGSGTFFTVCMLLSIIGETMG